MASDYQRGQMEIQEQVSTFNLFVGMTKWGSLFLTAFLTLLVLWFCTPAGFLGGAVVAAVISVLGVLFLRDKAEAH